MNEDAFFLAIRDDFPTLHQMINDEPLVYLDNAATTQKPKAVINALVDFYTNDNSNIHRGIHTLSERATHAYELARHQVQQLIHAHSIDEVVFTKGTTEGINWLASNDGPLHIEPGDEIIVSILEHHANFLPWQRLAKKSGAILRVVDVDKNGHLDLDAYEQLLSPQTKIVAMTMMSNVTGQCPDMKQIITLAHQYGALVIGDAAQAIAHFPIDVEALDIDFMVFSGHKLYAPLGIGILYGKRDLLDQFAPFEVGGGIVSEVRLNQTKFLALPWRLEAGTPDIAAAIGLGTAISYLQHLDLTRIMQYEQRLTHYLRQELAKIPVISVIGTTGTSIVSFNFNNIHPHDAATAFDQLGIAVRAGNHCAQPLMTALNLNGTLRVSLAFYNSVADIDRLIIGIKEVEAYFNGTH
ncbi:SufS family cysteine desulfurase [Weissella diestrammenae]|uniref:Cysteine desulfurase n=1 Tax=Weissella diestrammenae TaxID=1162633 RepID=A0A7G9T4X2_9LACO|nr:SufS family cysteine desulfurase [Weissella diestrammenae]MCM0582864.1 SufS family cysteine desulfurase [Weissella diestrammenae]QNN75147.1 SufS family cysteine desulfurase [Weissella diestrammenae]